MNLKPEPGWAWSTLAVAGAAQFLVLLEATVITIAVPQIGADLGNGPALAWVLSAYLLAFGAFLLPGGAWADRLGRRATFLGGLAIFTVASLLCAIAPSLALLVAARALQGAGAGVLAASALGIVVATYTEPRRRAIAMTVWSTLGVIGGVVGSLSAGPLIAWLDWPSVFWINVVAVVLLFPPAVKVIRAERTGQRAPRVAPAFVAAIGATSLLLGLGVIEAHLWIGAAALLGGLAIAGAAVAHQRRTHDPIIPVGLFKTSAYRWGAAGLFTANGIMIGTMFVFSQHLQQVLNVSATQASLAVLPMSVSALLVALATDKLIGRYGSRTTLGLGAGALALGLASLAGLSIVAPSWGWLVAGGFLVGAGLPASFVPLNRMAFSVVDSAQAGAASGLTNTITTLGGAFTVTAATLADQLYGPAGGYALMLALTATLAVAAARHGARRAGSPASEAATANAVIG
ncbi:MFS transporter [Streptosporangium roseum]|uniref:Transmembrane efflux protein n=1 Tax=Streptosporangium roseum (strain ATCC 12428 / DSM 43021 / JCM 3005 / KCTC 9067 / NCIMB 10171 / NRRL 2505 / NI 9100) TaxID=479432 RepID=D2AS89_STRRD|nr:MFS transporter [Streptosporangium roseum]ACZ86616.1 putative transmembrane efflux protein [Streptosporangium roseum DSM 43021]